ncbi:MAG: YggS family pyridoxal phosphate-dependent enzyme [Candidatus Liberibacter europaeus]|uniref:Pyridoxal phosphate homeostasis protein n=1 Tax=Candidatus Liberibacter europaeus TaxID=744859 RepID=A0A2T4VZ05_9HYPH|nr:YggS family pyridoxal phosphate-dependent enzyme [Candidatus Liberibacter europaeus]PTL87007.1 MAG: YggS family pyridoxal phosphate-dependent enzyme [Candidatus Liberibacter europaeus]
MSLENKLQEYRRQIAKSEEAANRPKNSVSLVAVSKMVDSKTIYSALTYGQMIFAENKLQEAKTKWSSLKKDWPVELRFIGSLQSNKVSEIVSIFDVIETVDREKIAYLLSIEMKKQKRYLPIYIQVNTGCEHQKSGVMPKDAKKLVDVCKNQYGLNVEGLMCIPPLKFNPGPHFCLLAKIARECGIKKLSMGMTKDYEIAIAFGATSVRIGTGIFGER